MARNPTNFFDDLVSGQKRAQEDDDRKYQVLVLRALKDLYAINMKQVHKLYDWDNDDYSIDPLDDLKYEVDSEEFSSIHIARVKGQDLTKLTLDLEHTAVFKKYIKISAKSPMCGLVFPIKYKGNWIIHNLGTPNPTPMKARLICYSRSPDHHDLEIVPLELFIKERKATQ